MKKAFIFSLLLSMMVAVDVNAQEGYSFLEGGALTLVLDENNEDNEAILSAYDRRICNVNMKRTIRAGMYNTLCLPFDVDEETLVEKFGEDVEIATLNGAHMNGDKVVFEFENTNEYGIIAGLPYLIHVSKDVKDPSFSDVTIKNRLIPIVFSLASFYPIYSTSALEGGNQSLRFVGANNTLYYPDVNSGKMKGFRAFFKFNDEKAYDAKATFVVVDNVSTGMKTILNKYLQNETVYDLQGRKVSHPTKGLYIVNGKKIVIR